MDYKALIKESPDFPIKGVLFRDVSPLLQNSVALQSLISDFSKILDLNAIDAFVGIESRGFIFASLLAAKYNKGFIPLRKAGKLPPPTVQRSYKLEYGEATLEMAPALSPNIRVVICDDVLATGGTLKASIKTSFEEMVTTTDGFNSLTRLALGRTTSLGIKMISPVVL